MHMQMLDAYANAIYKRFFGDILIINFPRFVRRRAVEIVASQFLLQIDGKLAL